MDHVATDLPASVASGQVLLICAVLVVGMLVLACELMIRLRSQGGA